MDIGIPRETSIEERRVALTPVGAHEIARSCHRVWVESQAGEGSGFSDLDYVEAGAEIVFSPIELYKRSDLVVKVEPLTAEEAEQLDHGQTVFSFVHLGMQTRATVSILKEKAVTAVGYELIEGPQGEKTVLSAMSEIAGAMLPQIAGRFLECYQGGRGVLLSGLPGIPSASVAILGAGSVGCSAAKAFLGIGAQVLVLDRSFQRLRHIEDVCGKRCITALLSPYYIEKALTFADVFVGAIFIHGERTPHLITREQVRRMKPGAVVIDVSIDQGGCVELSRPTTHSDPIFVEEGVIFYCVPNIPAAVARTASHALNNVVCPFATEVVTKGVEKTVRDNPALGRGIYLQGGRFVDEAMQHLFD